MTTRNRPRNRSFEGLTIFIERHAKCWVAEFDGFDPEIDGEALPMPFTPEAPVEDVFAHLNRQFPGAKVCHCNSSRVRWLLGNRY